MKNLRLFVVFLFMLMGMQSVMAQITPEMFETVKKDAEQGDIESQETVAGCYLDGWGVEKDSLKAIYWYTKAAAQGDHNSSVMLFRLMLKKDEKSKKEYESLNKVDRIIVFYLFTQDITMPLSEAITATKALTNEEKETIIQETAAQGDLESTEMLIDIYVKSSKDEKIKKEYESLNEADRKKIVNSLTKKASLSIAEITNAIDLMKKNKKDSLDLIELNKKSNILYGTDWGNNRCLADGTILYKRNGVLKVIDGKMVFTMNDGTVFTGFFKEQTTFYGSDKDFELLEINEPKLVNFLELTPWKGTFKYADGRTDEISGTWKKSEADKKHKEAVNAKIKQIETAHAKYTKKYGATYSNALSKDGKITKEMPLAFIKEYITDFNSMGIYLLGETQHITLNEYEPSMRDMTQYGKSVQVFRLFCGDALIWIFKVLNGKVIMTSLPQPGLEAVISMDRDWEQLSTEKLSTP